MTTTDAAALALLTWVSPGFPTGGFAHSQGLECAVEDGHVVSEGSAQSWIATMIRRGTGWSDAILLRHAHAAPDAAALARLARLAAVLAPAREQREATLAQGAAFVIAADPWSAPILADAARLLGDGTRIAHPVALGALAAAHAIDPDTACTAFLHAASAGLVSAALRLVPLGQSASLRIQRSLEPVIIETMRATRGRALDALGTSCFRCDIAAMRHEVQSVRLFRT